MASVSKKQRKFMGADYARAKQGQATQTGMDAGQLKDFASTPEAGLPERKAHAPKRKRT